jgi:hypothetical protein
MARPPKLYSRLARPAVSIGSYSSLWLAPDHVLQVNSTGYNERYQRFFFSDIQAFAIGRSNRLLYWNFFWGVVAAIPAIRIGVVLRDGDTPIASSIAFAVAATFLIWNNALGPTCRVHVVSRVQTVRLHALSRRRKAARMIGRVQPLIEAAQADLREEPVAPGASAPAP